MQVEFFDCHVHTEYSLRDGKIRIADYKDPKHIKSDIILNAERRNIGVVTATDHGNMYGQATLASVCKTFGFKHMPGCEFYIAPRSRFDRNALKPSDAYNHICAWAKNKQGYANMCILSKLSYVEGFYYYPRIDKELVNKYGDGIMWSDACVGGTLSPLINKALQTDSPLDMATAYGEFMWYLDRFKDDFYIEYQNHGIPVEDTANAVKVEWANKHGVPIIATTDAHFYKKEDKTSHKALLCIQYGNWLDNPTYNGFPGDGYWLMSEEELLERYPVEYLNNTKLLADKCEGNIIEFGEIRPPKFIIPEWYRQLKEEEDNGQVTE